MNRRKLKKSEADWALDILLENQEPMFYLDLINEIGKRLKKELSEKQIVSIYTRLNLDNRLTYEGDGLWFYDNNKLTVIYLV